MKKTLFEYDCIVHYGCSFTFGQDSGGDGIHVDELSYPSFLSKLLKNEYVNRAKMGSSNYEIYSRLWIDIHNKNFNKNTAVIVNLTSPFRTCYVYEPIDFIDSNDMFVQNKQLRFDTVSTTSNKRIDYRDKFILQSDLRFYLDTIQTVNAIQNLAYQYKIPLLMLDMHCGTHYQMWKDYFPEFDADKHMIRRDRPYCEMVGKENMSGVPTNKGFKIGHYYAQGYENIANEIYKDIKNEKL